MRLALYRHLITANAAGALFDLQGAMANTKLFLQRVLHLLQKRIAGVAIGHD
jgi:hypothetical protein